MTKQRSPPHPRFPTQGSLPSYLPHPPASWDPNAAKPAAGSVMLPPRLYLRSTPKRQTANILISPRHALMMTCLELRLKWRKGWQGLLLVKRCEKKHLSEVRFAHLFSKSQPLHVNMTESKYCYHCYLGFLFECQGTTKRERCWTHTFLFFHSPPVELLGEEIALQGSLLWDLRDHSCHSPATPSSKAPSTTPLQVLEQAPWTPSSNTISARLLEAKMLQDDPRSRGDDFGRLQTSVHVHHAWHVRFRRGF